ncbi:hypothetical protein SGPA1_11303 [Streptomyces misionensis JCM 4497]
MRLDHLLSKEHFLPGFGLVRGQYISECLMLVAHGWNVDYSALFGWLFFLVLLRRGTDEGPAEGVGHAVGCLRE